MKFIARLGRFLFAGMFLRIGPQHLEFETLAAAGEESHKSFIKE